MVTISFAEVFQAFPDVLRERLGTHYLEIKRNFSRRNYGSAELDGAKFCEVVIRILEWHANGGNYTPLGTPIKDFTQAIRRFESNSSLSDSVRFHIPNVLNAIYRIRNKRGVAHVAGEIDSNHMDATFIVASTDWIMAELVRLFHGVTLSEAQAIVESLITKQIPTIWHIGDHKRVISPPGKKLSANDKVLLLLYNDNPDPIGFQQLLAWTEYDPKNKSRFRNTILKDLHKRDLIHFDENRDIVDLSPLGIDYVEKNLPLEF